MKIPFQIKPNLMVLHDYVISYDTIVAKINSKKKTLTIFGKYSNTTTRHINHVLTTFGLKAVKAKDFKIFEIVNGR